MQIFIDIPPGVSGEDAFEGVRDQVWKAIGLLAVEELKEAAAVAGVTLTQDHVNTMIARTVKQIGDEVAAEPARSVPRRVTADQDLTTATFTPAGDDGRSLRMTPDELASMMAEARLEERGNMRFAYDPQGNLIGIDHTDEPVGRLQPVGPSLSLREGDVVGGQVVTQ